MIYDNVLELVGNTPLVKVNPSLTKGKQILAKLEMFNPAGSVKDRIALNMIVAAEREGLLKPGGTIIEPTSGNTGIGLAMVAAVKGYHLILTMPASMSIERRNLLKSYGAEIILTPAEMGMKGAIAKAEELVAANPDYFMPQQFRNIHNVEIHIKTTAQEIIKQTDGKIDAFVAGIGTGGTITGVGQVLKEMNPKIKVFAVEPLQSPVLSGGNAGPHRIQGIGAGFVPEILNLDVIDEIITIDDSDAFEMARKLAQKAGLLVGISSGAAMLGALKASEQFSEDQTIVAIFPDTGERYLSLFSD